MRSILDPDFRYVDSTHTDIRKTFERVRKERQKATQAKADAEAKTQADLSAHQSRVSQIFASRRAGTETA